MESTCPQNKNRTAYLFLTPLPTKQEVFSINKKEYKISIFVYMIGNHIKSLIPITKIEQKNFTEGQ